MTSSSAKPVRVAVVSFDGKLLGHVERRPHNANWRNLGRAPRVTLRSRTPARECVSALPWQMHEGWAARLSKGEMPPHDMEDA